MRQKKSLCLPTILLTLLLLSSCGVSERSPSFSYLWATCAFSVRGTSSLTVPSPLVYTEDIPYYQGVFRKGECLDFTAEITLAPVASGLRLSETGLPTDTFAIRMTYTAPEALSGLTLACVYNPAQGDATPTVTLQAPALQGSLTLPLSSVLSLIQPALCLIPSGDRVSVTPAEAGRLTYGYQQGDRRVDYEFSRGQVYPQRIIVTTPTRRLRLYTGGVT